MQDFLSQNQQTNKQQQTLMMKRLRQSDIKQWFVISQDKKIKSEGLFQSIAENIDSTKETEITMEKETEPKEECEDISSCEGISRKEQEDPYQEFLRIQDCYALLPPLKPSPNHTVLINVNTKDDIPVPYPDVYIDKWDKNHVCLPCSPHNLYPVEENGDVQLTSRWKVIEESLLSDIISSKDLEDAILKYNRQHASYWNFTGLHDFFKNFWSASLTRAVGSKHMSLEITCIPPFLILYSILEFWYLLYQRSPFRQQSILMVRHHYFSQMQRELAAYIVLSVEETTTFFKHVLPKIIRLALQLPQLCTQPIPLLERQKDHKITLSQKQVACLLANAFLCTYPRRNARHHRSTNPDYLWYPDINFNRLFIATKKGIESQRAEKLKCLLNYFRRIVSEEPKGLITFHRVYQQTLPEWANSTQLLNKMHVCSEGLIEKDGAGMLQVDFANKMVGGGVLGLGCVQEEIRFVLCPELLLSRLFTERLDTTEVLIVTGCEQFNKYGGYCNSFKWTGDFQDTTPWDNWKRRCTQIVAMDAFHFQEEAEQYKLSLIKRELNKAFCGFGDSSSDVVPAVATGNWGCGVFHGNPHLKSLIQLMAATQTHREIVYFTFGDKKLQKDIEKMYKFLVSKNITVGGLWQLLEKYSTIHSVIDEKVTPELYSFIYCELTT